MPSVLLIEDDIASIASLRRALSRSGYQVLVATNHPDAVSTAEHEHPAAFLVSSTLGGRNSDAAQLVEGLRAVAPGLPLLLLGEEAGTGEQALPRPVQIAPVLEFLRRSLSPHTPAPEEIALPPEVKSAAPVSAAEPAPLPTPHPPATASPPVDAEARRAAAAKTAELAAKRRYEQARAAVAAQKRPAPAATPTPAAAPSPPSPAVPERAAKPAVAPEPPTRPEREDAPSAPRSTAAATVLPVPAPATPPASANPPAAPTPTPESPPPVVALPPPSPSRAAATPPASPPPEPAPPSPSPAPSVSLPPTPTVAAAPPPPSPLPRAAPPPEPKPVFPPPGLKIPLAGRLGDREVAELLAACAQGNLTGRLRLGDGPGSVNRVLYWDQGRISGASSNSPEERLESLAQRRGLLTREQQRQLRSEAETATRRLALTMVERGYIKAAELFPLVQERVEEIAYEACGQTSGTYAIEADTVPDDERVALPRSPLSLMTEGIRRKFLMERLLAKLSGPATLLKPHGGNPDLTDLGLTAKERRVGELVDGLRNIEELLFETGIEPLAGLKVLYALLAAGHLEIAVRGISAGDATETSQRIDLGRIEEKHGQVRTANYFEILGVSEKATGYEVLQAYDRLSREFQPNRYGELDRGDTAERLEEIQRVLGEARDVLADERLRQDYTRHMRRS